ncbi:MAG: DUF5686 family protein [Flammeovirgaceae bacterium]
MARITIWIILIITLLSFHHLSAQHYRVSGKVIEAVSKDPLPFTHVIINKGENHAFTDLDGEFLVESNTPISQLTFKQPLHDTKEISITFERVNNMLVELTANQLFVYERQTNEETKALMEKAFANKQAYNPDKMKDISYDSYNKFTLSYGQVKKVKSSINKILGKFKSINKVLDSTETNHHLLMMESVTHQDYYNLFNRKESVLASKVSGIEQPAIFALTSQLQPFSIYTPETYLLGTYYNSPFTYKPFSWYHFRTIDTAYINQDTVYVVKFNPKNDLKILFLKGFLYINSDGYAVQYHNVQPAISKSVEMEYFQSYQKDSSGQWFPHQIETSIIKDRLSTTNNKLEAIDRTTIHQVKRDVGLKKGKFNEIVLDYKNHQTRPNSYWQKARKSKFTLTDSLTYQFYDSIGSIKNFENFIRFGEGLYYGEIPYKNIDLLLSRVVDFNQFEGLRVGLGLQTNERLFRHATFGGYFAFGINDDEFKYGAYTKIKLGKFLNTRLIYSYQNDLYESGIPEFPFDSPQFSSESLRGYRVSITDRIIRHELALEFQPIKYLNMRLGYFRDDVSPLYEYDLEGEVDDFDFSEIRVGFRYAFGEHYMESVHRKISFGTDYPIVWAQYTNGSDSFLGGEFDYTKWDFKLQKTTRTVALGTSYIQVRAGWINGRVPYQRLYRGLGSFRRISTIARNSFETMGYNEFISDRYVAIFYSHNLGDIYIRRLRKQPSLVVSQNMGWGSLRNPGRHGGNQERIRTMEKGYFETGAFMNNILVLSGFGINVGLGAGIYLRYGPYQLPVGKDNRVFKIAIDFQL